MGCGVTKHTNPSPKSKEVKKKPQQSSQDSAKTGEPEKKSSFTKKGLLKASIGLVFLATLSLFGKIYIDGKVSGMENSLNHLRPVDDKTFQNVQTSNQEWNGTKSMVMQMQLLQLLNETPQNIKFWEDKIISQRHLAIWVAYIAATGGVIPNQEVQKEWTVIKDTDQLEVIYKKYLSQATAYSKTTASKIIEFEAKITQLSFWGTVLISIATFLNSLGLILGFLAEYFDDKAPLF